MVRRMTDTDENMTNEDAPKGERIAKVLARAGVASRREVERMIEDGRVWLHGKKLETPATLVSSLEGIHVDGEPIGQAAQTKLWRYHKTRGTLTTHRDPEGRPTVFERLPNHMGRVISVGRLDMNTEGLLLFTNDGALARWLELPANSLERTYRVRVHGYVNPKHLEKLKDGTTIDGVHYGPIDAKLERQQGANAWITVSIREGKNREVRRIMESLQLDVNRLIRTHYGPFSLGSMANGAIAQVGEKQMHELLGDFFDETPETVAAPTVKHNPSKWAKAKKPTKVKLGANRKRKWEQQKQDDVLPARSTTKASARDKAASESKSGRPILNSNSRGRPISDARRRALETEQGEKRKVIRSDNRSGTRTDPKRRVSADDNKGSSRGKPYGDPRGRSDERGNRSNETRSSNRSERSNGESRGKPAGKFTPKSSNSRPSRPQGQNQRASGGKPKTGGRGR